MSAVVFFETQALMAGEPRTRRHKAIVGAGATLLLVALALTLRSRSWYREELWWLAAGFVLLIGAANGVRVGALRLLYTAAAFGLSLWWIHLLFTTAR